MREKARKARENKDDPGGDSYKSYKIGFAVFYLVSMGLYFLKKERAVVITMEEAIDAVKKSQTNVIHVVKERVDEKIKGHDENEYIKRRNFRRLYLKIDGV